jgi:predicted NUDIX family phosphoesterase
MPDAIKTCDVKVQLVLTVPAECVTQFYRAPAFYQDAQSKRTVFDAVYEHGNYVERDLAESNESIKQIVAYATVRHGDDFLCLRRSGASNREVLQLRYTLLVGGHVDETERASAVPLVDCLLRELNEELGVRPVQTPRLLGIVADPNTLAGRLHLGVVFEVTIADSEIEVHDELDHTEFAGLNGRRALSLLPHAAIAEVASQLDPWSSLVFSSGAVGPSRLPVDLPR